MKFFILTNNPYVRDQCKDQLEVEYREASLDKLLEHVREKIHMGHKLLTHPLSGSVKPYETPYKSVMVSEGSGILDVESLEIIESSIQSCEKFKTMQREYQEKTHRDLQLIDYTLISSAISSAEMTLN